MSEETRICRQCDILSKLPQDVSNQVAKLYALLPGREKATEEQMLERIAVCSGCDRREGSTCLECGCYIEIRVMKKDARCPKRNWK